MLIYHHRYLHVCILLYRPLLVFYFTLEESNHPCMSEDITTDLQKALYVQSSKTCVIIAQDLIKTIKNNIKAQLPAWWYSIFCKETDMMDYDGVTH